MASVPHSKYQPSIGIFHCVGNELGWRCLFQVSFMTHIYVATSSSYRKLVQKVILTSAAFQHMTACIVDEEAGQRKD